MNIRNFMSTLIAACAFAVASHAGAAVILQVNSNGILTGATGVNVSGKLYDVTFEVGSCNSVFNNCNRSEFAFRTLDDARLATQALLDQVFIDGPAGLFDSEPNKTVGCASSPIFCETFVPFFDRSRTVARVTNAFGTLLDTTDVIGLPDNYVSGVSTPTNFAYFRLVSLDTTVPEPSSIALMGLALAGLAFKRRGKE